MKRASKTSRREAEVESQKIFVFTIPSNDTLVPQHDNPLSIVYSVRRRPMPGAWSSFTQLDNSHLPVPELGEVDPALKLVLVTLHAVEKERRHGEE